MASSYPTHGAGGKVMVGGAAVAMLTGWSISSSSGVAPVRYAGATALVKLGDGMVDSTVNIEAVMDGGDTAQNALIAGGDVTLVLHPDAGSAGDDTWSCSGIVESRGIDLNIDGAITTTAVIQVSGAITKGVVGGG